MDFLTSFRSYFPTEAASLETAWALPPNHGLYFLAGEEAEKRFVSAHPELIPHAEVPHAYVYPDGLPLGKTLEHNLGAYYVMDPASMLPPYFLAPQKGERVLDFCAAPGGKTALLSSFLGEEGVLLSNDLSYPRSLETSRNVERLGLRNVAVTAGDFSQSYVHYRAYFDAIMLDAPCSGSAMFRKEPRMREDWSYNKVLSLASTQRELLELAAKMLAYGGRILYSTCSFSYEEDEGVVLSFLKEHPEFEAVSLPRFPSFYSHEDLPEGVHLFPHRHQGEGQFFCLLRHKGEKSSRAFPCRSKGNKEVESALREFGLEGYDVKLVNGVYHALSKPLRIEGLSLLRYGVALGDFSPSHPYEHALAIASRCPCLHLDAAKAHKYLHGDTFPLNEKDGYAVVSYSGLRLGFVKVVHGVAKNHYPKGLRRDYPL